MTGIAGTARFLRRCRVLWFCIAGATSIAGAQEIHGTVVNADGATPATGAVVVLLHATRDDSVLARTVTGERGLFALPAPSAGTFRLRVLRIGYQPFTVGTYTLARDESRTVEWECSESNEQASTTS